MKWKSHHSDFDSATLASFEEMGHFFNTWVGKDYALDIETFVNLCCRMKVNGIELSCNGIPVGGALFRFLSFFNHSCQPNCAAFQKNSKLYLIACKDILPGDAMYISYMNTTQSKKSRLQFLQKEYFFTCECTLCQMPDVQDIREWIQCSSCHQEYYPTETEKCPFCNVQSPRIHLKEWSLGLDSNELNEIALVFSKVSKCLAKTHWLYIETLTVYLNALEGANRFKEAYGCAKMLLESYRLVLGEIHPLIHKTLGDILHFGEMLGEQDLDAYRYRFFQQESIFSTSKADIEVIIFSF